MTNLLTAANLKAGIKVLKVSKPAWGNDFHDTLYIELKELKANGLDEQWWQKIVYKLWDWKAIRPLSRATILHEGLKSLPQLRAEYNAILKVTDKREPRLETVSWDILSGLYTVASSIKKTKYPSPVFGSKLCHFILPKVFPVIDREMVGVSGEYREYWINCKEQWMTCTVKQELIMQLQRAMKVQATSDYPWASKIVELCKIGAKR